MNFYECCDLTEKVYLICIYFLFAYDALTYVLTQICEI